MFIGCPFPLENVPELIGPGSSGQMAAGYVVASSLQSKSTHGRLHASPLAVILSLKLLAGNSAAVRLNTHTRHSRA
jgi:hypothetical protein